MVANSPFVLSSFIKGAARVLDLGATTRKRKSTFIQNDNEAMCADWVTVGKDLDRAMVNYDKQEYRKQRYKK